MTKYNNRRVTIDNITFASVKEARRYEELKGLQNQGVIRDLQVHKRLPLYAVAKSALGPSGSAALVSHVADYVCDFYYYSTNPPDTEPIIEDCKSEPTRRLAVYRLKKRMVKACHGVEILET